MLQPVCSVLLAINSSTPAVLARLLAIYGTPTISGHGSTLSRRGAVSGGTLTVLGPAPRDLPTRIVCHLNVARRQLTITFGANFIALSCRPIATVSTRIAISRRASAQRDGLAPFARVAVACVAHEVMQAMVATRHEVAIA